MNMHDGSADPKASPLERLLKIFADVRGGEALAVLLLTFNIFLILTAYYIIKTLREPLILNSEIPGFLKAIGIESRAEVKTYASAGQAIALMAFIPAYSWIASRVDRMRLIVSVTLFFVANIVAFAFSVDAGVSYIGVAFFIWVGIFSLSIIAQFWSYANDIYTKEAGDRLFPIIGIGMTAGSPVGAWVAKRLFEARVDPSLMLYVAAGLLLLSLLAYLTVNRRASAPESRPASADETVGMGRKSGFSLVFANRYILMIAGLLVLLNIVNTTGEFILSHLVEERANSLAAADPSFDAGSFIGAFYGGFFFWVNIAAVVLQAFVASRLVKFFGLKGVLFALPLVALGAYGLIALFASLGFVRWIKTAENSTDYSLMNTAKQLLWLPTTREEKYKAKQTVDVFFVRIGDVLAAVVVYLGTAWLSLGVRSIAVLNLGFVALSLLLALALVRRHRALTSNVETV
jgi:AAA family ATP:ADP antiporter